MRGEELTLVWKGQRFYSAAAAAAAGGRMNLVVAGRIQGEWLSLP